MTLPSAQHIAQFYENDRFLTESVAEFIKAGLQVNEKVIVIATASHAQTLRNAFNQDELCHDNFTFFDATVLLAELMVEDWPDHSVFMRVLGHPIQEACHRGRVRVYGEMVAVLWSAGHYQEALCLEGLWNTLQTTQSFALLHAYPRMPHPYSSAADPLPLLALYQAHSHVYHQNAGTTPH
jgi:hypothetical protein